MKTSISLLAAAIFALGACNDTDTAESVSGAIPSETYKGKTEQVLIIGNDTDWQPGTVVDFGEGVTVQEVMVASPTSLLVTISTDGTTPAGPRDVVVNGSFTLAGGFEVLEASAVATQGTVAQGSISVVSITGQDVLTQFDTTSVSTGLFSPPMYTNIAFDGLPAGALMNVGSVSSYEIQATLVVDVNATPGDFVIDVVSGPPENQVRIPFAVSVGERAATPLTGDTSVSETVRAPFDSQLYSLTVPEGALVQLNLASLGMNQAQSLNILGASGSFAESVNFGLGKNVILPEGQYYAVLWDNSGESDFEYTVTPFVANVPAGTPAEASTPETPQAINALPGHISGGAIAVDSEDVYAVTIGAEQMGKSLVVGTYGTEPTDTTIEVVRLGGEEPVVVAQSEDAGFHDSVLTGALDTPGTYLVYVRASSFHQDGLPESYSLAVWTE